MSTDMLIPTPATEILPGDRLDLEGDRYATMLGPNGDAEAHASTISRFEYEYAVVEELETECADDENPEVVTGIVIHTSLTSFACPPDHRLLRL